MILFDTPADTLLPASELVMWGTPVPIEVTFGQEKASIYARGSCSLIIIDAQAFREHVVSEMNITARARPLIIKSVAEVLPVFCQRVARFEEVEYKLEAIGEIVRRSLQSEFENLGLSLTALKIHTIEKG